MKKFLRTAVALGLMAFATNSYALFDAQLLVGSKSGKVKTEVAGVSSEDSFSSTPISIAAHIDPIPLVPVAFGLGIQSETWKSKDSATNTETSLPGITAALEVMAWAPIPFAIKPYGKFGYVLYGKYTGEENTALGKIRYIDDFNGMYFSAGLKWSIVPLIGLLLEYNMGISGKLKPTEYEIAGQKQDLSTTVESDVTQSSILLGVQLGI